MSDFAYTVRRIFVRICVVLGGFVLLFLLGIGFGGSHGPWPQSSALQTAHAIGIAMYSYAQDNHGKYPDGKSSTEVFQKLLDGGYINYPDVFYLPLPGKRKASNGQKLKPENVCWDVTSGVDATTSDLMPLVFMTGYQVNYTPGGDAIPRVKPYFPFWKRTWQGWWRGEPDLSRTPYPGMAVYYKGNRSAFWGPGDFAVSSSDTGIEISTDEKAKFEGIIPRFISPDFKPDGKTYRQLTPDGVLP